MSFIVKPVGTYLLIARSEAQADALYSAQLDIVTCTGGETTNYGIAGNFINEQKAIKAALEYGIQIVNEEIEGISPPAEFSYDPFVIVNPPGLRGNKIPFYTLTRGERVFIKTSPSESRLQRRRKKGDRPVVPPTENPGTFKTTRLPGSSTGNPGTSAQQGPTDDALLSGGNETEKQKS